MTWTADSRRHSSIIETLCFCFAVVMAFRTVLAAPSPLPGTHSRNVSQAVTDYLRFSSISQDMLRRRNRHRQLPSWKESPHNRHHESRPVRHPAKHMQSRTRQRARCFLYPQIQSKTMVTSALLFDTDRVSLIRNLLSNSQGMQPRNLIRVMPDKENLFAWPSKNPYPFRSERYDASAAML